MTAVYLQRVRSIYSFWHSAHEQLMRTDNQFLIARSSLFSNMEKEVERFDFAEKLVLNYFATHTLEYIFCVLQAQNSPILDPQKKSLT